MADIQILSFDSWKFLLLVFLLHIQDLLKHLLAYMGCFMLFSYFGSKCLIWFVLCCFFILNLVYEIKHFEFTYYEGFGAYELLLDIEFFWFFSFLSLRQVLALPLPHRPLFPGFYMPIYVKVLWNVNNENKACFFLCALLKGGWIISQL